MITLAEQIKCVGREVGMRKNVYPKRVARGQMSPEQATHELAAMEAVLESLKRLAYPDKGDIRDVDLFPPVPKADNR